MHRKFQPHEIIFILLVAALSWFPIVNASFMNDDYQMLGMEPPSSLTDVASPFFETNVWGHYWRPLVEFFIKLLLFIDGYNPILFRSFTLLLFSAMVLTVVFASGNLGVRKSGAILAGVIFALLPSRELHASWIADWGDSFALIFILLMLMSYLKFRNEKEPDKKYLILSSLYFLSAILSKEIAFAAIFLPALCEFLFNEKKFLNPRSIKATAVYVSVLILVLVFRITFISSNPFDSPHLNDTSAFAVIRNFLLYAATIFFPPDYLEILFRFTQKNSAYLVLTIVFAAAGALLFFFLLKNHFKRRKNLYIFLALWFVLFLLPVLPVFMRWYSLSASFGLITAVAILLNDEYTMTVNKKYFQFAGVILFAILLYLNLTASQRWNDAGIKMDRIMVNIFQNKERVDADTLYVWGCPDKYLRAPLMKLGINESFAFALKRKNVVVHSPLRIEIYHSKYEIDFIPKDSTNFVLVLKGGRFLQQGGRSRAVPISEEFSFTDSNYNCNIKTTVDEKLKETFSFAEIEMKTLKQNFNLYFDGKDFRRVKPLQLSSSAAK